MQGAWKILSVKGQSIQHNGPLADMIGNFTVDGQKLIFRYGNNHFGKISVNGDSVTIGPLAGTRMFVDIQPKENFVIGGIQQATKFKIENNNLSLLDGSGNVIVQLTKV